MSEKEDGVTSYRDAPQVHLLGCPFACDGHAPPLVVYANPEEVSYCVECPVCNAQGPVADTEAAAIAAWNKRSPPPELSNWRETLVYARHYIDGTRDDSGNRKWTLGRIDAVLSALPAPPGAGGDEDNSALCLATPPSVPSNWRPIAEAETDEDDFPIIVAWDAEEDPDPSVERLWHVDVARWDNGWVGAPDSPGYGPTWVSTTTGDFLEPTHWQHLPSPPGLADDARDSAMAAALRLMIANVEDQAMFSQLPGIFLSWKETAKAALAKAEQPVAPRGKATSEHPSAEDGGA